MCATRDTGTHRQPPVNGSTTDAIQMIARLKETDADGINDDTMASTPLEWWNTSLAAGYPIAFQPEGGGHVETMEW